MEHITEEQTVRSNRNLEAGTRHTARGEVIEAFPTLLPIPEIGRPGRSLRTLWNQVLSCFATGSVRTRHPVGYENLLPLHPSND